jgi:hypothetical protein
MLVTYSYFKKLNLKNLKILKKKKKRRAKMVKMDENNAKENRYLQSR